MFTRISLAFCLTVFAATASAEDRIVQRTASGSRIGMPCVILDYTGRQVVFQTKQGGATRRIPRREILEVTTHYTPPHAEAKELLAQGKPKEAFAKLNVALDQENRVWVRREILATQVKCALWHGDRVPAGERFLAICDSDPETVYFPLMPLAWDDQPPSPEMDRAARQWLSQADNPASVLLGASHLLTDVDRSSAAQKAIRDLARNDHPDIQRYSQIQLWRAKVLSEDVSRDELLRWERLFEDAGPDLGGGPRYILGMGWNHRHDDLAAAAAWLWLPLVSGDDRWLAAEAAWNAGQALERAGQVPEAAVIYREIGQRYSDTPSAPLAAEVEKRIANSK